MLWYGYILLYVLDIVTSDILNTSDICFALNCILPEDGFSQSIQMIRKVNSQIDTINLVEGVNDFVWKGMNAFYLYKQEIIRVTLN